MSFPIVDVCWIKKKLRGLNRKICKTDGDAYITSRDKILNEPKQIMLILVNTLKQCSNMIEKGIKPNNVNFNHRMPYISLFVCQIKFVSLQFGQN